MSPQPHRGGGGARMRWIPSGAPSLTKGEDEYGTKKSRSGPGGGPPVSSRAPSLMEEEDGMRWGRPASSRRGSGGRGGGQEDQEGARSRRAPSLLQRRKTRRGEFHISSHRCKIIPGWSVGWLGGWSDRWFPICPTSTKVSVKLTKMSWC